MVACGGPSLEKYYVNNQEKDNFIVVNVPANLFLENNAGLSTEEKATLQKVEKANVLVFLIKEGNEAVFKKEKATLENILKNEKYKLLMKFGSPERQFRLMYLGDADAIDEMIVYGSSSDMGFGVARILGDNMDPGKMIELMKSMQNKDNLNIGGIKALSSIFSNKKQDSL